MTLPQEVQSLVCCYLHEAFIAEPTLAKLVHFQVSQVPLGKYGRYSSDSGLSPVIVLLYLLLYASETANLSGTCFYELCCRATPWSYWEWQWLVFPPCTSVWTLLPMSRVAGLPPGAVGSDGSWCSRHVHSNELCCRASPLELLGVTVAGVPSMHICLDLASNELCCRATPLSCWEWQWLVFFP
jgi:hypothetical protein